MFALFNSVSPLPLVYSQDGKNILGLHFGSIFKRSKNVFSLHLFHFETNNI